MGDIKPVHGAMACCALGVVFVIFILAGIKTVGRDEQLVIEYLSGKEVLNGPKTKVINPFRASTKRKALRMSTVQYAKVKNGLNGDIRVVKGPVTREFLGAYEEYDIYTSEVIKREEYVRLVDYLTGEERIVNGPTRIIPGPYEINLGIELASFVTVDSAALVLNKATGVQRLVTSTGLFFPEPFEWVVEMRPRIRVLTTEAIVVRTEYGSYKVYSGADGGGTGVAFFLQPFEQILSMTWSVYSEPQEGGVQAITRETLTRIDLRARKTFYQYEVRTMDNVALRLEGTIYWKISDVGKLIARTADPVGDVWNRARNILISAIGQVTLQEFMMTFNPLIRGAFQTHTGDAFWLDRGIEAQSMEVTKYECLDQQVADTLQAIIEETTNRINRLQQQRSISNVQYAKLLADIKLEIDNEALVKSQAKNKLLTAELEGEAIGIELSKAASTFIEGLNVSLPNVDDRVMIYKLQEALNNQNARTAALGSGKVTMFLTPDNLHLTLNTDEF